MSQPQSKSSPLNELCSALPSLPMRLREVGQFVAANDYDATTRSMRDLAAAAGADPASFTRLAKALGYSGWDGLRAALTEARRPAQPSPFSGRTKGRRQGPNSDVSLVADKLEAEAAGLARISPGAVAGAAKALHAAQRIWIAGFRSCRGVADLLNYQLRLFRPDTVQLVGGSGPEDLDLGAFRAGDAVIVIGFAPYSTASVLSARAAHRSGARLVAITDAVIAPMAEGADHLLLFEAAASPGFFPSLTGAIAIAQSLAAVTFVLGGAGSKRRLEETEVRLAAMSQYVAEKG
jgi:DNA-binding MurR/RpiR family transcriptional regulator